MLAVGLTGGIGAGKSTVADLLVERGAVLIDADRIARQVVEPGQPAHQALVERFGTGILAADGTIDRPALAAVAFSDPRALADLNAITHPVIGATMDERRRALESGDDVVLLDIPLMTPDHRQLLSLDVVVVVDCDPEIALARLVGDRSMAPDDARARMAAQPGREQRLEGADLVVDNSGERHGLELEVDRVWTALRHEAEVKAAARRSSAGGHADGRS